MQKLDNFLNKNQETETEIIKTDISHIYSLLENNSGGSSSGGNSGDGSTLTQDQINKIIEEKLEPLRFYNYRDILNVKFTLLEGLRYKAVDGYIALPPIMFFHYTTADTSRPAAKTITFNIDCFLASKASKDNVVIKVLTNNNKENLLYKDFNFEIEQTGTNCSFSFDFKDVQYQIENSACPIIITIKSLSNTNMDCHLVKASVDYNEFGNFADKPNYFFRGVPAENLQKKYITNIFPLGLPYTTYLFVKSDTAGYIRKLHFKDFIDQEKMNLIENVQLFEETTPTNNYEYSFTLDIPPTNCKDFVCGKLGNAGYNAIGSVPTSIIMFYLSREGYVYYRVYETLTKQVYEGKLCDGIYDSISFYAESDYRNFPNTPLYLVLKEVEIPTTAGELKNKVVMYNLENYFYKTKKPKFVRYEYPLDSKGFEGFQPIFIEMLNVKECTPGFSIEMMDSNFRRKNIMVRYFYNKTNANFDWIVDENNGRLQLMGSSVKYNRYACLELVNNTYYIACYSKYIDQALKDRRNEKQFEYSQLPGGTRIVQLLSDKYMLNFYPSESGDIFRVSPFNEVSFT